MKKRIALTLAVLLVFGAVKLPIESSISAAHRNAFFHGAKLNLTLREQIGQGAFLGALSGFRGVIADFLCLEAYGAWEHTQWNRVILLFNQITTLQPRVTLYWSMGMRYMAYDAATAALRDPNEPREALRIKASRAYMQMGREFIEQGIRNNPDRSVLYDQLGALLLNKMHDYYGAYEAYLKASELPESYPYQKRSAAYALALCPGKEAQAYALLVSLYREGRHHRVPKLLSLIKELEQKLNVPSEQRVYNRAETPK